MYARQASCRLYVSVTLSSPPLSYRLHNGRETSKFFNSAGVVYDRISTSRAAARGEEGEEGRLDDVADEAAAAATASYVLIYPKKTSLRRRLHVVSPPAGKRVNVNDGSGEVCDSEESEGATDALPMSQDDLFVDFVSQTLQIDPQKRLSAEQALRHPWLDDWDQHDISYGGSGV